MPIREIELMQQAGMTPFEIILAATRNAAVVCNQQQQLGTLEAGKLADVLVVKGNPLEDIHAFASPLLVLRQGVIVRDLAQ
jgi:imidazolonepropionase-like amidohydrolase